MTIDPNSIQKKNIFTPDEVRPFALGHMDVVKLGDATIGRAVFEPGWRWSTSVKPIAGTASCQISHLGYLISGRLHVRMDDGTEAELGPGDVVLVRPGHDAWVVGDVPVEYLELAGAETYATGRHARGVAITMLPERDTAAAVSPGASTAAEAALRADARGDAPPRPKGSTIEDWPTDEYV